MKNYLKISQVILSALALGTSMHVFADVPKIPHIQVTGVGQVQVEPDQVEFSFSVSEQKRTALEAKQEVDQRINNLLQGIEAFDIEEDDISASQITTRTVYEHRPGGEREQVGYTATRNISVTLGDISRMSEFMDYVLSVGIPEIQSIQLGVNDAAEMEFEARNRAIESAKAQASTAAQQFNAELGDVYSVNLQAPQHQSQYGQFESARMMSADASGRGGQYLEASIEYSATVHVVFYLE